MIWLTWRQFRVPATIGFAAVAVLAAMLVAIGVPSSTSADQILELLATERTKVGLYTFASISMLLLPALIGMFWGAPLVARELEAGTHRLVWNQSVTRTRWLATKLVVIGLSAMVVTGVLGLVLAWWAGPIDDALARGVESDGILGTSRMEPSLFAARGLTPMGYAAFAFALGVTAGALLRRTVPAMAVTAIVFAVVQLAVPPLLRANLDPVESTTKITPENLRGLLMEGPEGPVEHLSVKVDSPGAWTLANETIDRTGQRAETIPGFVADCIRPDPERQGPLADPACFARFADAGYRQRVTYQPASRYWTFQVLETAFFLVLAGALAGFSFWWVRRRVT